MSDDAPEIRLPKPITEAYLQRVALAYLERFASSSENLRRVLQRRVAKRCRLRDEDPAPFTPIIDEIVEKSRRTGLVNDKQYAENRAATLRRRGGSARAIGAKLAAKGIDRETIAQALAGEPEDEEQAAYAFARRRRLGPFNRGDRKAARAKDLASLARAGFPYDVARRVIDSEPREE